MPSISQQIMDLLSEAHTILKEINSANEAEIMRHIDDYIKKQSEFEDKFESAKKIFIQNEDQLSEENLKEIINRIKENNNLLLENNTKIKNTTKIIKLDTLHQQINTAS